MDSKINELRIDEVIWITFIILNILNIIGDEYEKDYYINNNDERDILAKDIFTFTVFISLIIYLYILYKRYVTMKDTRLSGKDTSICDTRFFGSILVVTASILFLYCQIKDRRAINPSIE